MLLWTTRGQCGICPPDQLPKCTCVSVILQKQQMLKVGLGGHSDYNTKFLLSSWTPCEEKSMQAPCSNKGGLISEGFSLLLKSKRRCQITLLNTIHLKKRCSGVWFGTFFRLDPKWKKSWDYASFRIWSHKFQLLMYRKLFGPTVGKNRSSDQEKLLKIRCWRPRIYNF